MRYTNLFKKNLYKICIKICTIQICTRYKTLYKICKQICINFFLQDTLYKICIQICIKICMIQICPRYYFVQDLYTNLHKIKICTLNFVQDLYTNLY